MNHRIKAVSVEMANFLRVTQKPQQVIISPAAKSVDSWMRDITASVQVYDDPSNLVEARINLVSAQKSLESKDLSKFISSVKSALECLDKDNEPVEQEPTYYKERSIKSLMF